MILEDINERLSVLSYTEQEKVLSYINNLIFKNNLGYKFEEDKLLIPFQKYYIYNWENLALIILRSGVPLSPMGGYMKREDVEDWLVKKYYIGKEVASKIISILIRKELLQQSYYGNIG